MKVFLAATLLCGLISGENPAVAAVSKIAAAEKESGSVIALRNHETAKLSAEPVDMHISAIRVTNADGSKELAKGVQIYIIERLRSTLVSGSAELDFDELDTAESAVDVLLKNIATTDELRFRSHAGDLVMSAYMGTLHILIESERPVAIELDSERAAKFRQALVDAHAVLTK